MSVSTFASDFDDDIAEPIDHLEQSAPSKTKEKSYYKHSRYSIFFQVCHSCFWSVSNLYKSRIIERSPSCKSSKIGSLPIAVYDI
jgi:hypothetical protein